jgi:hypothetical protein
MEFESHLLGFATQAVMKMLMLQSFLLRSAGEAKREQGEDVVGKQGTALLLPQYPLF